MRTNSKIVAWGVLFFCALYTIANGQSITPSVDPEREVIVMFKSDAVIPPENRTKGRPDEFQIPEQGLRQVLLHANIEAISRLMPDFRPEERHAVTRTGEEVQLTDWSNVYVIRLPQPNAREGFLNALKKRPAVIFAEPNGRAEHDLTPNDEYFNRQWALKNDGTYIQGSGTAGADINATQAWDITTGSSSIKIGIVDGGMQTDHPDFAGRVTGDAGDGYPHGTVVAGVAAAQGNNSIGVAGVAWNVGIINEDYGAGSDADNAAAVRSASNRGADIINNSWKLVPVGRYSTAVRLAFADVYKQNRAAAASMGNQYGEVIQYPAAFGQGIITVGATTNEDVKAVYSSTGNWIDVVAPGGAGSGSSDEKDDIYTTTSGGSYGYMAGTSFAVPVATGIAALLLSVNPNLYNDDVEQIIRVTADEVAGMGGQEWTTEYGTGRVNARKALDLIRSPNTVNQWTASGGSSVGNTGYYKMAFYCTPGLAPGVYIVKRYDVRKTITFPQAFESTPHVWGRGVSTNGYSIENPNFGMGWCDIVPGSVTPTGATLQTYCYIVYDYVWQIPIGWFPTSPSNVTFAYTALGILAEPPPAPQNLTMTNAGQNGQRPHLSWDASSGADSYKVYRSTDGYYWYVQATVTNTSYTDQQVIIETNPRYADDKYYYKVTAVNAYGESGPSNIVSTWGKTLRKRITDSDEVTPEQEELPKEFALLQNYPNPGNPTTMISFQLPKADRVMLRIVNLRGQEVKTLVDDYREAGTYSVIWDGKNNRGIEVPSGIYLYTLRVGNKVFTKKLTLLK